MSGVHIAFLTESGPGVGLGHLSRCLSVAKAAVAGSGRASFLLSGEPPAPSPLVGVAAEVGALDWSLDLSGTLGELRRLRPDAIVVDSYAASTELFSALRALGQVVVLDDLADRPLPVDVVVNGSVAAEELPYDRGADTLFLLGPRYAPLDPSYAPAPVRRRAGRVERALICLGGSRQDSPLRAALAAADRVVEGGALDVVTGPFADNRLESAAARGTRNRVCFHRSRFGLRELMEDADVAISGAGVTLYELAATATPAVALLLAPNQRPNFDAFARAGAALAAGAVADAGLAGAIESALRRLADDPPLREAVGARGRALVDGGGAARVVQAIGRGAVSRR